MEMVCICLTATSDFGLINRSQILNIPDIGDWSKFINEKYVQTSKIWKFIFRHSILMLLFYYVLLHSFNYFLFIISIADCEACVFPE